MDSNKIRLKKIKPGHIMTTGYFIFLMSLVLQICKTDGIIIGITALGIGIFLYGLFLAMGYSINS